jgi:hypothetical protein
MKKDINPQNNKGLHGYQEWYAMDKIWHRGTFKDNEPINYAEWHPRGGVNDFCVLYIIR